MSDNVTIDPRYSKYDNHKIEEILDSVAEFDEAPTEGSEKPVTSGGVDTAIKEAMKNLPVTSEENVRNIVKNYNPDPESEPENDEEDNS